MDTRRPPDSTATVPGQTIEPQPHPAVVLRDIRKTYGGGGLFTSGSVGTRALDGISLRIEAGEFVAVTGPSGCGKSTLLNILGLIDRSSGGSYRLFGQAVDSTSERERAQLRRQLIGIVFQSFNLIDELSVFENVELAVLYHGWAEAQRRERVSAMLERLEIGHRAEERPGDLSGGQQQRVAIARALVGAPRLLLADEPTGNLDSAAGEDVMRIITELTDQGTTVVMVTHSAFHAQYAARTIHLLDGQVVAENRRAPGVSA